MVDSDLHASRVRDQKIVTHDLAVVAQIADHIVVLYNGEIKEAGPVETIINKSEHPYTTRLMGAIRPLPEAGQGEISNHEHMRDAPALEAKAVDAGYGKGADGKPKKKARFPQGDVFPAGAEGRLPRDAEALQHQRDHEVYTKFLQRQRGKR